MRMRTKALAVVAASLLLAGCSNGGPASDGQDDVIIIGVAAGLTGDAAVGDVPMLAGAQFAVEEINAAGGAGGFTVQIESKDMKSDSTLGGTVAQELIDDGADILIGPAFPGMASGILQVAQTEGIPVVAGASTQPEYTYMSGARVFLAAFGDNVQAAGVAEHVLGLDWTKAFLLSSPDMTYTSNGPKFFADAFEHGGGSIVGEATYSIGQTDFSAQVTDIAAIQDDIDVIFAPAFPPDLPSFVRALRAAGVETPVVGPDGFHTAEALAAGQDALNGTVFATHAFEEPGSEFADWVERGIEFDSAIADGPAIAGLGYTSVQIIAAAIEAAGSGDPEAIADAIAGLSGLETVTGEITYEGTSGVPKKSVTIGGVENGEFVNIETFVPSYIPEP